MEDATTDCAAFAETVLGHGNVAEKSNEIIAIPKLLDMSAIEGTIVAEQRPRISRLTPSAGRHPVRPHWGSVAKPPDGMTTSWSS